MTIDWISGVFGLPYSAFRFRSTQPTGPGNPKLTPMAMLQKSTVRKSYGILNRTFNRPMPICALDDNGTRHVHLCQHLTDFGNSERGEEGIHNRTSNETW